MSRLVTINQIIEGMELEHAVKNQYGQLLLPANARLEEKHKKILKTWGISSLYIIEELNDSAEMQTMENQKIEELKLLHERFRWSPRNKNEEDLFEMVFLKELISDKNQRGSGS